MRQTPEPIDWQALRTLRDLFLAGEPLPAPYWVSRDQLDAYDRTLGERIGWKWDAVLSELRARNWRPPARTLIDYGCGTGIAARRVLAAYPDAFDDVLLHDHSGIAMAFARERIQSQFPGTTVRLAESPPQLEGVVLLSHILSEMPPDTAETLATALPGAAAILWVEPGTHDCSHRLIQIREFLRTHHTLVAPCPHQQTCGLLEAANAAHWCHHFAPAPSHAHQDPFWGHFRREMNLDIGPVAYSFFVTDAQAAPGPAGLSHLIGRPIRAPKYLRVLSCQESDIAELVASRRAGAIYRPLKTTASPALYAFERRKNRITGGKWLGE